MTVQVLLLKLAQADIRLSRAGGELVLDAPAGALTPELLEEIRQLKASLLSVLRAHEQAGMAGQEDSVHLPAPPRVVSDDLVREVSRRMAEDGSAVIHSRVLNATICFTRDQSARALAPAGAVAYTRDELKALVSAGLDDPQLRLVHRVKQMFDGSIERQATGGHASPAVKPLSAAVSSAPQKLTSWPGGGGGEP